MNSERSKKYGSITEQLNKALGKALDSFALNTEWSDIPNWLANVESLLRDYPSPFLGDKILLSKRLNQCMNHILPEKVHEGVLRIHQTIFRNMRLSVEGNPNDYIKLFAQDLGVYSLSLLPHFAHTSNFEQRLTVLRLINHYYLDLGKELIPMLPGLLKSLLSVYSATINTQLLQLIETTLERILHKVGRRYVVGCTWSLILKYKDCKMSGIKFLSKVIEKMDFIEGEESFEESRGFSDLQLELQELADIQYIDSQAGILENHRQRLEEMSRGSKQKLMKHLNAQDENAYQQNSNTIDLSSAKKNQSPINMINQPHPFDQNSEEGPLKLENIMEEPLEESVNHDHSGRSPNNIQKENQDHDELSEPEQKDSKKGKPLFQSQAPFLNLLKDENQILLNAVPLMVTPGIQKIREGVDDPSLPQNNFPRIGTLVVGALISTLQEEEPIIRRTALDFMFTHLRIKSDYLGDKQRGVLVQALLRLFKKKQISITKRVNRWLFGKQDEQNRFLITQKNQFVVEHIITAFQRILSTVPTSQDNCTLPLKILQNFYIEHSHLVEPTLAHISMHILRYVFNFGSESEGQYQRAVYFEQVFKMGRRFLQNLPSFYPVMLESLGQSFVQGVSKQDPEEAFEAVKYIDFCYINLMQHEHSYQQLEYITIVLDYLSQGLSLIATAEASDGKHTLQRLYLKDAVLLIYNLVERRRSVLKISKREEDNINQQYYIQTGGKQLTPQRVAFQQHLKELEQQQQQKYIKISQNMEKFFIQLGFIVRNFASVHHYEQTFKLASMSLVGLQLHQPAEPCSALPRWFTTLEGAIKVANPMISLAAIESMIRCLMWEEKHPIYHSFKAIIVQEKANKRGIDYQKLALEKLWSLLDYPHMHSKIIDLIVTFSKHFPYEFTETVKRSFSTNNAPDKEASIQRFSHFWRLTAYKYKDLLTNKEFAELNKVGLFRMLDFLDDPNPLVRHAAKTWLMESMTLLRRVLQPLLLQLINGCSEWYQTPKGLLLIQKVYDTNLIFSTFRRIRSILSNGSYSFLRFVYQTEITELLDQMRETVTPVNTRLFTTDEMKNQVPQEEPKVVEREPVLPRALESVQKKQVRGSRMSYLDLLIVLTVKYIEGHAVESMGVEFYLGNSGVNASAVELIETLLDYIDNPVLCQKLLNYLMDYLFKVLGQVVQNKEYIMQIQLLNLIRNTFFNSSFRKKAELSKVRAFFKTTFTNKSFLVAVLQGLNTPFAYIRSQFIAFITISIPLIADFLDPPQCTECIRHILYTYYKIIKNIGISLAKSVPQPVQDPQDQPDYHKQASMSRILELEERLRVEQKVVRFSDNLKQVGKTNQILSVLQGVEAILNYFYDLDKLNPKQLDFQFSNPYTLFDTFKKIITLGLASSNKRALLVQRKNFLHNFETCEALLKDLQPVYETILRSWPLSQQFVRIGSSEFSCVGMRSFNFQRFSRYNKVVKELIEYVIEQRQSIWGKIYCIMQPMFCSFPKQIIDIYLKLWIRECAEDTQPDPNRTELLMKIMQTIIVNNFRSDIVIHAFLQSTAISELTHYYSVKNNDKRGAVLDFDIDKSETKLLYFLYVYFNYVYLNEKQLTYEPLLEVWSLIMKALQPFRKSKTPLSAIWIIEIINLCAKKYSPKELLKNQKFKTDLHALINEKLKYLGSIASRKQVVFFEQPIAKANFEQLQSKKPYGTVLPLPPTIYDMLKRRPDQNNSSDQIALKEVKAGENAQMQTRYRVYCFKVLKRLGLEILQNTYLPQKTHWVVVRTCEWIDIILPVIEEKSTHNQLFAECASEVLHDLLQRARLLFIKELKPRVLSIFNKDDFFICNPNTLQYWAHIIDWVVSLDKNCQTYLQYLQKVSLSSSYFTSESTENKRRIKSFERICFILYSGGKDRYANKLNVLLAKIVDVIKRPQNAHAALLILILFSIRILILRLSEITLNQLFIDIWPMLLTLLMQTFSKQLVRVHIHNEISKNPNYLLAALKLIEMISLANLGEFAHHQWIFLTDYFGVDLKATETSIEMKELFSKRPQLSDIIDIQAGNTESTPFTYRPYLLNYLPPCSIDYINRDIKPKDSKGNSKDSSKDNGKETKANYQARKRLIVVKDSFIRDEGQLRLNALLLIQYLVRLCEWRTQVDWEEVENVIVSDFISLDSFIHQIS